LDGYGFDGGFQCALKGEGLRVLAVDDIGKAGHYAADIVLNVNVGVDASFYASREPYTRLLTGADYFLFRREFTDQAATERVNPSAAKKILVTLGGSDPNNVTEKVLHLLKTLDIKTLDVTLVLGGSNPHAASVEAAAKTALFPTCVVRNAGRLSEFMAASDLAVTSVGTTAWELAFMKTPACVVVSFDYQRPFAEKMGEKAFLHLGWWESLESGDAAVRLEELIGDKNARDLMSEAGRNQVDGKGADRVLREMLS
jgi:spore coat polysaccharide biosynthesis predicted glycosyltransferase SpsG